MLISRPQSGLPVVLEAIHVARSSTEEEYKSPANTAFDVPGIKSLLKELQVPCTTHIMFSNNLSTMSLTFSPSCED